MSEQYTTDGHGLMRDGKRYAVCDTPAAAEDLARMGNSHEALVTCCKQLHRWISEQGYPIPAELNEALKLAGAA